MALLGTISVTRLDTGEVRTYAADTLFEPFRKEFYSKTIAPQRDAVALTNITGGAILATQGLWRREMDEFSEGAGQFSLDRKLDRDSSSRFYSSKGIDVFSKPEQAILLPDTHQLVSNIGTNLITARCGDYLVVCASGAVTYYNHLWAATPCRFGSDYGGTTPTVINSITTNDIYAFVATDTGIWFCQIGASLIFQLYAGNDLTTGYTGGYDMVRWANDQLVGSKGPRLYAFQPRDGSATSPYGSSPSTSSGQVPILNIIGSGSFLSTAGQAEVYTQVPHNLTTGQKVTIQNTQMNGDITSLYVASGHFTATCSAAAGVVVGQKLTVSMTYTTGRVITENVVVKSVSSTGVAFTCNTSKITTSTNFSLGTFISSEDQYGFNTTYTVTVNPPSAQSITATIPSSPSAGYVTYTINQTFSPSVGDYLVVAGLTPAGYNGTFVVTAVGGTTGAFTATVVNSTTGTASGSGTALTLSRVFTIPVPKTNGASATGGTLTIPVSPDTLYTHQNASWVWSDATGGETQLYITGYVKTTSGNYSGCVYRSNLLGSSTSVQSGVSIISNSILAMPFALDTPIQALPMSPDEVPTCIKSYLNYIFIGTNRGIRMCQTLSIYDPTATATGDLKSGPLIPNRLQPVSNPVTGIVGDGRFVWFTWSNYDASSTGLGKMNLQQFIAQDPLAPVYASDIMVTGQGVINSLDWDPINTVPIMAVQGLGIYGPYATNSGGNLTATQYVPSGTLTSSYYDFGIAEAKIPVYFDYGCYLPATGGSMGATVVMDPLSPSPVTLTAPAFTSNTQNPEVSILQTGGANDRGKQFQTTVTLTTTNTAYSPQMHRWTMKAWATPVQGSMISAVISLFTSDIIDNQHTSLDPQAEFYWLESLRWNQTMVTYTAGQLSVTAVIDAVNDIPDEPRGQYPGGFQGTVALMLKTVGPYVFTAAATS